MGGQSREGGKKAPKKAAKKAPKEVDSDDERKMEKLRADKKANEAMKAQLTGKSGPLNTGSQGIKKSGKK